MLVAKESRQGYAVTGQGLWAAVKAGIATQEGMFTLIFLAEMLLSPSR